MTGFFLQLYYFKQNENTEGILKWKCICLTSLSIKKTIKSAAEFQATYPAFFQKENLIFL